MKKKEVPQDDDGLQEGKYIDMCYVLDENGNYVTVQSIGWKPKNEAMKQAWDLVHEKAEKVRQQVLSGELSPLAFYMEMNIMDLKLLAQYAGLPKRTVKKHLKPAVFETLGDDILEKYAEAFDISLDELRNYKEILKTK